MTTPADTRDIETLLGNYATALRTLDVDLAVSLYTDDGAVMAPGAPTGRGAEGLRARYNAIFSAVKLDVNFIIDDVLSDTETAAVMTHSEGTASAPDSNDGAPEFNRELFVLRRVGGDWKIARYSFNKDR